MLSSKQFFVTYRDQRTEDSFAKEIKNKKILNIEMNVLQIRT